LKENRPIKELSLIKRAKDMITNHQWQVE